MKEQTDEKAFETIWVEAENASTKAEQKKVAKKWESWSKKRQDMFYDMWFSGPDYATMKELKDNWKYLIYDNDFGGVKDQTKTVGSYTVYDSEMGTQLGVMSKKELVDLGKKKIKDLGKGQKPPANIDDAIALLENEEYIFNLDPHSGVYSVYDKHMDDDLGNHNEDDIMKLALHKFNEFGHGETVTDVDSAIEFLSNHNYTISPDKKAKGKLITYDDGYQFREVDKAYVQKNWQNEDIYGLNLGEQSESLIDDEDFINDFEQWGIEAGFKKPKFPVVTGKDKWSEGELLFMVNDIEKNKGKTLFNFSDEELHPYIDYFGKNEEKVRYALKWLADNKTGIKPISPDESKKKSDDKDKRIRIAKIKAKALKLKFKFKN